jgi:TonB family protein
LSTASATTSFLPHQDRDQLGWGVLVSLGLHVLLVAALVLWPGWHASRRITFAPVYSVRLVGPPRLPAPAAPKPKPAVRVKPKPKSPARPAPRPKPAASKKEAIGLKKKKAAKPKRRVRAKPTPKVDDSAELDKRIRRLQRKVAAERALERAISRIQSRVASRNNTLPGAFASAGGGQLSMRFQVYYTQLWEKIRRHWVVPEALVQNTRGLMAVIVMRIRKDGSLAKVWLEQSSGNPRFDTSALRAVERAAPFPPLPAGLRQPVHEVGVRFRIEDITQ